MKPCWGIIRTIKGTIAWVSFLGIAGILLQLLRSFKSFNDNCKDGESACTKKFWLIAGSSLGGALFLVIAFAIIRHFLVTCFPVTCGHRKCIFTGRSSKPLRDILLSVDENIPREEDLTEFQDKTLAVMNDIRTELEQIMQRTRFQFIFSGSAVERYGIPFMLSYKPTDCACNSTCQTNALYTDLDVMFCSLADKATFSGEGHILVEPFVTDDAGFTGYAKLTSLTPGYQGSCVSSKLIRDQAKVAVENTRVSNLPGVPCCCGMYDATPKIQLHCKGPAMKISIKPLFEADVTLCFHCTEWPTLSDWPSRPRYWPSLADAQRMISLGCHLVAKPAPSDVDQRSWRFSFSLAEVELSKLVPEVARKCFVALKIILKDHLQPVLPEIGSYHIKTIFLNTLERVPLGFWTEDNIEECMLTLLTELCDALLSVKCPHHWFSFVNLFSDIDEDDLQRLARKVERIIKDPAPFIFDDGCCCLSPCCFRVPHYNFTRRTSQQFLVDYDEITISVDGNMIPREVQQNNSPNQLPAYSSVMPWAQMISERSLGSSSKPDGLVVTLPPVRNPERRSASFMDDSEMESSREAIPLTVILPPT